LVRLLAACRYVETITPTTWHRIASVEPGTWTLILVDAGRVPMWFFEGDNGEIEPMLASDRDWWRKYGTRKQQGLPL